MSLLTSIGDLAKDAFSKYVFHDSPQPTANAAPSHPVVPAVQSTVVLSVAPTSTVGAVATAVGNVAQLADDKLRLNNTDEMKLALKLSREQVERDRINKAIADNNLEAIRRMAS